MPSYHYRTAVTRLDVSTSVATRLEATITAYRRGANLAAELGWEHSEARKTKLQAMVYDEVRERTDLGSQHAILAIHQAAEALQSVQESRAAGRSVSIPSFTSPTVTYDTRTMTLFEDEECVSLATTDGRVRCGLSLPEADDGYQYQYLDDDEWELTESTLTARDGEYFLHLGFRTEGPTDADSTADDSTVLGVDLGIENLVVTSTACFLSGQKLLHEHREFDRIRAGLQRTGTQSSHRTYVRRADAEARYTRDCLHRVANEIVSEALEHRCHCIVFEDLTHIRDSMPTRRKFHQWAHRRLVDYVTYKAEARGIEIAFVDPQNTSRRCCECGHTTEQNRAVRNHFECIECGAEAHADYNAAKNIGFKYVRCGPQSSQRTGDSRLALKSGTVTPNGNFTPCTAEDTDKSAPPEATRCG